MLSRVFPWILTAAKKDTTRKSKSPETMKIGINREIRKGNSDFRNS